MRPDLPSGTVTFLFTDVEGSTRLLHSLGAEGYSEALAEHRRVIREACVAEGGVEVDTQGDAFFFAFPTAPGAVAAASAFTENLASGPIQVRVGLHTGTPLVAEEGYVGDDVHFAARVAGSGHGGQVICSSATAELVELPLTDLGEHRLKDVAEAVSIFQLGNGSFPPLMTISNTNLPRPASSFVGREAEVEAVLSRIEGGARLVTLTGPGGSGKTRLAIEAASTLVPEYKAGVFWVGLAALRDPALVTETIAQTLGAKDGLAGHVGERELLLLLDNLEQVIESAPELASLVERCPNLSLLVTSRERLHVRGEVEYEVPPLAEPEAVSLFCERSQLEPSEEIAELCARLDSLPLAVELAAARTKALSPAQIRERLSERLDLLKGGRDADPRQQTLRATIEWSYDLLSDDEQQLFARLSVFAGGCTLEAAEKVAGADLDTLQSLVEKSLLRFSDERYWMLETIREYAAEQLADMDDPDGVRQRHADHLCAFAEDVGGVYVFAGAQPVAMERLAREHDNFRAAIEWSLERGRFGVVLRFGAALWMFWLIRGHAAEGRRWLDVAVAAGDRGSDEWVWAALALSEFDRSDADVVRARMLKQEILPVLRERGEVRAVAGTLADLGDMAMEEGEYELARELLDESLELRREPSAAGGIGRTLASLGELALLEGDLDRAEGLYEQAFKAAAERDPRGAHAGWSLRGVAEVRQRHGDVAGAEQALRDALRIWHGLRNRTEVAGCLDGLAATAAAQGLAERVDWLRGAAADLRRGEGATLDEAVEYALSSID